MNDAQSQVPPEELLAGIRQWMDNEFLQGQIDRGCTLVVGPALMATVEAKAAELAVTEVTVYANGDKRIAVYQVHNPDGLTADESFFLHIVKHASFSVMPTLLPTPAAVKPDPRERMDHLRRVTRQDWRRRR